MKACRHQKETIMLDVYGELGAEARGRLENHLATCEACRQEHRHLENLIANLNSTMAPAQLAPEEVTRLAATVGAMLKKERERKWWQPNLALYGPKQLIPAMAAACVIIVISAIWIYSNVFNINEFQPTASLQEKQLLVNDLEIIENLDLLKEMEAIQKLVKAVDKPPNGPPSGTINQDSQGKRHNVYGKHFA
jgi:hypothetical protein